MKRKSTIQPIIVHNSIPKWIHQTTLLLIVFSLFAVISCGPPRPRNSVSSESKVEVKKQANEESISTQVMDAAYFIREIMNPKRLATYKPGERMISRSSHAPNNGPVDAGNYLDSFEENGKTWWTLLDEDGPGVLTRMNFRDELQGTLRIYVDYQKDPIIETTFQDLYASKHEIFQLYLSSPPTQSGGGFTSFFPVPFSKHIRIIVDQVQSYLQYQFDMLALPPNSPVETFNGKLDQRLRTAMEEYNTYVKQNAIGRNDKTLVSGFVSHTLKAGETKLVVNNTGPAAISFFALQINPMSIESLENTIIKMYWDDMTSPAVDITLRDFFCANVGIPNNWNSFQMGYFHETENFPTGFYFCQFYMPYQTKGQVTLENTSDTTIQYKMAYKQDYSELPEDFLYFYARSDQRRYALGMIHSLFEFEGKGKLVGMQMSSQMGSEYQLEPKNFFYSGDSYFYINGEENASIISPGLDSYFNGGKLLDQYTPYWLPTHGTLYNAPEGEAYLSQSYRFHLLDAIPFSTSMFYAQEIGCPIQYMSLNQPNTIPINCRWTCYWYGKMAETKVERKENAYFYTIEGNPNSSNPVMIDLQVYLQIPPGKWTMRYAPVYDLSQVYEQEYDVQ